jgi:glycosyltransferase 2 family protein
MQINTKSKPFQIFSYILFLIVGVLLLWLAFRNQDFNQIWAAIKSANLWMIVPVFIAATIGGLLRTLRWQMLINPLGFYPSLLNSFNSLMFGYFVNYAVPRLGEFSRCISLNKKEDIPVTTLFGTVMAERTVDMIMLILSVGFALFLKFQTIYSFFNDNLFAPLIGFLKDKLFKNTPMTVITLSGLFLIIYFLFKMNKKASETKSADKLDKMIDDVWIGLSSILKMKNWGVFVIYTILIWLMYFLTSFFWLLSFNETKDLGISTALVIMVIGTVGKSAPTQGGGMGAYHFLVSRGLALFAVSSVVGNAYALVNHGSMALYQVIVGTICGIILWFTPDKKKIEVEENNV